MRNADIYGRPSAFRRKELERSAKIVFAPLAVQERFWRFAGRVVSVLF